MKFYSNPIYDILMTKQSLEQIFLTFAIIRTVPNVLFI